EDLDGAVRASRRAARAQRVPLALEVTQSVPRAASARKAMSAMTSDDAPPAASTLAPSVAKTRVLRVPVWNTTASSAPTTSTGWAASWPEIASQRHAPPLEIS